MKGYCKSYCIALAYNTAHDVPLGQSMTDKLSTWHHKASASVQQVESRGNIDTPTPSINYCYLILSAARLKGNSKMRNQSACSRTCIKGLQRNSPEAWAFYDCEGRAQVLWSTITKCTMMISMHITHMSLPRRIEELRSEVEEWQDILMCCFGVGQPLKPYAPAIKPMVHGTKSEKEPKRIRSRWCMRITTWYIPGGTVKKPKGPMEYLTYGWW